MSFIKNLLFKQDGLQKLTVVINQLLYDRLKVIPELSSDEKEQYIGSVLMHHINSKNLNHKTPLREYISFDEQNGYKKSFKLAPGLQRDSIIRKKIEITMQIPKSVVKRLENMLMIFGLQVNNYHEY